MLNALGLYFFQVASSLNTNIFFCFFCFIINSEDNSILSVDMPLSVVLEVIHTEPGVKGNTATNATKPAKLETGATVNVPLFINEGDKLKIDTEKSQYIERIK